MFLLTDAACELSHKNNQRDVIDKFNNIPLTI